MSERAQGFAEACDNIARAVRALRHYHGWTQAELAERAGCSRSLVRDIECGQSNVRTDTLAALSLALGVEVVALIGPWGFVSGVRRGRVLHVTHSGDRKIQVIKAIREHTNLGLKEAKETSEGSRCPVPDKAIRDALSNALDELGATYTWEPS